MRVYDCFMYFDEEIILDLRLNMLNEFVDHFVIVESLFTHRGEKRKLKFDHKKFEKFKSKIIYLVNEKEPEELSIISDPKNDHSGYIMNAVLRENNQRNFISEGLKFADNDDFILNNKSIPSANFPLKTRRKQTKKGILAENFNLK